MDSIKTNISNEVITDFPRVGQHENFVITHDLNMVQQVRVITLDKATGQPLVDVLTADESLTADQKQAALQRYADQIVSRKTDGAFVDATGQVVEPGTVGAISQRDFFQAITIGSLKKMGMTITDKTPVVSLIYALMSQEITNIDKRGGL